MWEEVSDDCGHITTTSVANAEGSAKGSWDKHLPQKISVPNSVLFQEQLHQKNPTLPQFPHRLPEVDSGPVDEL